MPIFPEIFSLAEVNPSSELFPTTPAVIAFAPPHGNPNKVAQTSADNCFLCVVNFVFINFLLVFKDE